MNETIVFILTEYRDRSGNLGDLSFDLNYISFPVRVLDCCQSGNTIFSALPQTDSGVVLKVVSLIKQNLYFISHKINVKIN